MNEIKVLFIGIGSIAKRHIRNLKSICDVRGIKIVIDAFRRDCERISEINDIYTTISEVPNNYNAIFITNPTEFHISVINEFSDKGNNFFIEKPICSINCIEQAKELKFHKEKTYYVAAPLRYSAVIQYIKHYIDMRDVISVRSISSSYLPDWRLGQDYRKTYSANKSQGGGVSIDLIHEWDYLTYLFGFPNEIKHIIGKKSNLEIDSDDYAIYIAEYTDKILELHLDYFGRKTIRKIELIMKEDTIIGDIANNTITFLKEGETIEFNEERDDYQKRELNYFIDMVIGRRKKINGVPYAIDVLAVTQGRLP